MYTLSLALHPSVLLKPVRAAQTIGAGTIHLDEADFMQRPRHMTDVEVVLHKVDGDLDLLKMVKARPPVCLKPCLKPYQVK